MEFQVPIRLVWVDPPPGVDFGIQRGSGASYQTLLVQRRTRGELWFDFSVGVADDRKDGLPRFKGPFAQGPPAAT